MATDSRYICQMTAYQHNEDLMVMLDGVMRMQNAEDIKKQIIGLLDRDGMQKFYLNTSMLSELDSAGLGVLVGLHMTARKLKKEFCILSPTAYQMQLLEGTRLTSVLAIIAAGMEAQQICDRLKKDDLEIPIEASED